MRPAAQSAGSGFVRTLHRLRLLLLPGETGPEARILILARAVRSFGDGLISLVLPAYLAALGFSPLEIGTIATASLLGSSIVTLAVGRAARLFRSGRLLIVGALLMAASGIAFILLGDLWPLVVVAFLGTINPSSGEASIFMPIEHARLTESVSAENRTGTFVRYTFFGTIAAGFGAFSAQLPQYASAAAGLSMVTALQLPFLAYALLGLVNCVLYARLPDVRPEHHEHRPGPLRQSRGIVLKLTVLFALDAFGGGFVVQSLTALWLFQYFGLSLAAAGRIFFWIGILSAFSLLAAPLLARRWGLIRTMVFTHLPASICLTLVPLMPTLALAVALLLLRSVLSQLDIPTRASYVMAVVHPSERAAAAGLTAVPRGLASAASPVLAGALLGLSSFGWPLLVGGVLKIVYDVLLLRAFAEIRPAEELAADPRPLTPASRSTTGP